MKSNLKERVQQVVGNREDPHGNLEPYAADRFKLLRRPVNLKMQIKLILRQQSQPIQ